MVKLCSECRTCSSSGVQRKMEVGRRVVCKRLVIIDMNGVWQNFEGFKEAGQVDVVAKKFWNA